MRELMEGVRLAFVVGICAVVFGGAWAATAPYAAWRWYGALLALLGFSMVAVVAVMRLVADWATRPLEKWTPDETGNFPEISEPLKPSQIFLTSRRLTSKQSRRIAEDWRRRLTGI